jgi:hypothetical protein
MYINVVVVDYSVTSCSIEMRPILVLLLSRRIGMEASKRRNLRSPSRSVAQRIKVFAKRSRETITSISLESCSPVISE